jgi:hypothetical protein
MITPHYILHSQRFTTSTYGDGKVTTANEPPYSPAPNPSCGYEVAKKGHTELGNK